MESERGKKQRTTPLRALDSQRPTKSSVVICLWAAGNKPRELYSFLLHVQPFVLSPTTRSSTLAASSVDSEILAHLLSFLSLLFLSIPRSAVLLIRADPNQGRGNLFFVFGSPSLNRPRCARGKCLRRMTRFESSRPCTHCGKTGGEKKNAVADIRSRACRARLPFRNQLRLTDTCE